MILLEIIYLFSIFSKRKWRKTEHYDPTFTSSNTILSEKFENWEENCENEHILLEFYVQVSERESI